MQSSKTDSFQKTQKNNRRLDDGTTKKVNGNSKKFKKFTQKKNFN